VIGFLKGKSAIAVARQFGGKERNFTGEHLWARGYSGVRSIHGQFRIRAGPPIHPRPR
jgi:hypothetical protein